MSGLDPLAALAAQAVANAQAAIDAATLSLGADVATLQAQISVGDVIAAKVLAPQGGIDLLSLLGQTVVAQIPPGIHPGESLLLQVTGFTNSSVLVRNLGTVDPDNPIPTVSVELPPSAPGAPQTAVLTTRPAPQPASPAGPPPAPPANAAPPATVAPPREVFVAAALRAVPAAAPPAPNAPPSAPSIAGSDVETRIALDRARSAVAPPSVPAAESPSAAQASPVAPPPIVRAAGVPAAPVAEAPSVPPSPEAALLARLRVPVTPATLAAARLATNATEQLTGAYERLDALLARAQPQDLPAALRSSLAFVSRFDLRSTAALPEQIAAYVSGVVDGAESKLAQIVQALTAGEAPASSPSSSPSSPPSPPQVPQLAVNTAARAVERAVALEYDVKTAIAVMIAESARGGPTALTAALHEALTATTAVQINALSAQTADPSTITLALPAYFHPNGQPVQMKISRDAPDGKKKMDGDNFHITFVLDTATLGTVAIDVQTVGRAVSVDVKTQASVSADRFRTSLGDLRGRLESLRYRVAKIGAGVAAPSGATPPAPAISAEPPSPRSLWDTRA